MIDLSWSEFKELFKDNTIRFKTVVKGKDYLIFAKDDWLEFSCNTPLTNEDARNIIEGQNSKAIIRARKK